MIEATLADMNAISLDGEIVYESNELLLAGNGYRLFVGSMSDLSASVLCKPNGASNWYIVQSFPNGESSAAPIAFESGDVIKVRAKVIGNAARAEISFCLQDVMI